MADPQHLLPLAMSNTPYSYSRSRRARSPTTSSPTALNNNSNADISNVTAGSVRRSLSANTSSTAALSSELLSQTARHAKEVRGAVGEAMQLRQIMEKQEKKIAFLIGELKLTRAKLTKSEADLQSASTSLDRLLMERKEFEQRLMASKSTIQKLEGHVESLRNELSRGYADQSCNDKPQSRSRDNSPKSICSSNDDNHRTKAALISAENLRLTEDLTRMEREAAVLKRALVMKVSSPGIEPAIKRRQVIRSHELQVSVKEMQETARSYVETQRLRDESIRARDQIDSLRGDCANYRAEIDRLKSEVNHLSSSLSRSEATCKEVEKERDEARREARLAALERSSILDKAGHLPAQLEQAQETIRELEEELSRKAGELSGLTTAHSATVSEYCHEKTLLSSKVDKYEHLLADITTERKQLREDLDKARLENARLAADFKESFERASANEIAANAAREHLVSLEGQIERLRKDVIAGASEGKRRDAEARRVKAEISRGQQLLRAASGRDRIEELVDELREGLSRKQQELKEIREGQYDLESSLVNRVNNLKAQLDDALCEKRVSTMAKSDAGRVCGLQREHSRLKSSFDLTWHPRSPSGSTKSTSHL